MLRNPLVCMVKKSGSNEGENEAVLLPCVVITDPCGYLRYLVALISPVKGGGGQDCSCHGL